MLYVGTYSTRGSEGIYSLAFDAETGALSVASVIIGGLRNPSFIALHPGGRWLYSVCEEAQGAVAAIALSPDGLSGSVINSQSTGGLGPCHVAVDPTGQHVAAANYGSGSVALFPVRDDGGLGPAVSAQHAGSGPDQRRQQAPHAHSANFSPCGRFLIVPDLGIDRLMLYRVDEGKLMEHSAVVVEPGSGPRHFTFHPNNRRGYLINELSNTVVAYRWDATTGTLTPLQTLSTLPPDFDGTSYTADIHFHPSGRYLYGSNRGHDSLAIFAADQATGRLTPIGYVPTGGEHPRNFTVTANGGWLLCGNMNSDNVVVFRVLDDGARLEPVADFALPAPVCLVFGAAPGGRHD